MLHFIDMAVKIEWCVSKQLMIVAHPVYQFQKQADRRQPPLDRHDGIVILLGSTEG